jgi:hypothetical protein
MRATIDGIIGHAITAVSAHAQSRPACPADHAGRAWSGAGGNRVRRGGAWCRLPCRRRRSGRR